MAKATLAVLIVNYNHAHYMQETFESLFSQSRLPDQVLVIDDCSTDNSVEIISKYLSNPLVRFSRNDRNLGVTRSMALGLSQIHADYVYVLGADDKPLPGFLEKSLNMLERYPQAGLSCTRPAFMDEKSKVDLRLDSYRFPNESCFVEPQRCVQEIGWDGFWIAGHTCIFRMDALRNAGGFPEELEWMCDWFTCHVLAYRYGICFVAEPLASWRILSTSYSSVLARDPVRIAKCLWAMVGLIKMPQYADIRAAFAQGKVLDTYPKEKSAVIEELEPWRKILHRRQFNEQLALTGALSRAVIQANMTMEEMQRIIGLLVRIISWLRPVWRAYKWSRLSFKKIART